MVCDLCSGEDFDGKKIVGAYGIWIDELHYTYESLENANLDKKEKVRAGKKRHDIWMAFYPVMQKAFGYMCRRVPSTWPEARDMIFEAYKRIEDGTEYGWEDKVA